MNNSNTVIPLKVSVNNKKKLLFTEAEISQSLKALCYRFKLYIPINNVGDEVKWEVLPGDDVIMEDEQGVLLIGQVDTVSSQINAVGGKLAVTGRCKLANFVDSSAPHVPGEYRNISLESLAEELVSPFGFKIKADDKASKPIDSIQINAGKTCFEVIERLARSAGVVPRSNGIDTLLLDQLKEEILPYQLEEGVNIIEGSGSVSVAQRYSTITVVGQAAGTSDKSGEDTTSIKGEAYDSEVNHSRRLVIVAEDESTPESLNTRAKWAVEARKARGTSLNLTVQGWRDEGGNLWELGQHVMVNAPTLAPKGKYRITGITRTLNDRGSQTRLEFTDSSGYSLS